jgi:hypothetical protein
LRPGCDDVEVGFQVAREGWTVEEREPALVAAVRHGLADSPVTVATPAGPLELGWEDDIYLTGPAEIVAGGEFHMG